MEKLILALIIVLIIFIVVLICVAVILMMKKNSSSVSNGLFDKDSEKRIIDDNDRIRNDIFNLKREVESSFHSFKDDINQNNNNNFQKTSEAVANLKESLARIDEAQKNLGKIDDTVNSFKEIFENNKKRGNLGEFQLNSIVQDIFGPRNLVYEIQSKMPNGGEVVDLLLKLPDPVGNLPVDSKFPLMNYRKMVDTSLPQFERDQAAKLFASDVKNHINDISSKYIVKNYTTDNAVMFIPSEAVFSEIYSSFPELIDYANKKKIWITSPTTLTALLETIVLFLKEQERSKDVKKILEELNVLSEDFRRYEERWEALNKSLKSLTENATNLSITASKISTKFKKINERVADDKED